jgi:hypothetical protein
MKKIILIFCALALIVSCTKQKYYDIPLNSDGTVYLTGVPTATTTGISTLDAGFSVTATFVTAKAGDVMNVELLQLQDVTGQATKQLLPMAGTQSTATVALVGTKLQATVTYTRDVAKMTKATDFVTVVFNGATDYNKLKVPMVPATTVSKPKVSGREIDVARTSETAYFNVTVVPNEAAYTGNLVVKMKNGNHAPYVAVTGSPFSGAQPYLVPISGTNFAANNDTMYYSFTATKGNYVDEIIYKVIVRDPYFYLKKTCVLTFGGSTAARNLLINAGVASTDVTGQLEVSSSLLLKGGTAWLAADPSHQIGFVPTTSDMYAANNLTAAKAAFNAAIPTITADPANPAYIYKMVLGPLASDVYYGMIKMVVTDPQARSVSIEYRIGDQYAHLLVIQ